MNYKYGYTVALLVILFLAAGGPRAHAASGDGTTWQEGALGPVVAALQIRLNDLGYDAGPATGFFSWRTREAVRRFQSDNGLPALGLADPVTLRQIETAHDGTYGPLHIVAKGETLTSVAGQYGTQSKTLQWMNLLRDTALKAGRILRIPWWGRAEPAATFGSPAAVAPNNRGSEKGPEQVSGGNAAETGGQVAAGAPSAGDSTFRSPAWEPSQGPSGGNDLTRDDFVVLGYYVEDWEGDRRSLNSLRRSGGVVDLVVNFQMAVDESGNITTRSYPELMAEARALGVPVEGLLHNWSGDNFSAEVARRVVSDPTIRARTIANVMAVARQQGLSGINVDLERVPADQRQNYTEFVRLLYEAAKSEGLQLTLSVPGKTYDDTTSSWDGAFDYRSLGDYADYVVVMAYDEHLPGLTAGPVASYRYVQQVTRYAASQIPAEKILLGLAAYGYDWVQGSTAGRGLSVTGAMELAEAYGATVRWDEEGQVPYFTYYRDGVARIVYYEDARSTAVKLNLVRAYGLGGVAIWRLGLEDPFIWSVLGS